MLGPNLRSFVHHVSVLGSVVDTHNSNKIDIKNHTFIANGKNTLHGLGYIAWPLALYCISEFYDNSPMSSWLHSYRQLGVRT